MDLAEGAVQRHVPVGGLFNRVRLITRGGFNLSDRYLWIVEAARKSRHKQFVIYSEAVLLPILIRSPSKR